MTVISASNCCHLSSLVLNSQSVKLALNKLGYKTCHWIYNQFDDWIKAHELDDETQVAEIEKILSKVLKNYTASCDNPCCGFFMELMKMNPNAKVILTVRDTPGTGLISFKIEDCKFELFYRVGIAKCKTF